MPPTVEAAPRSSQADDPYHRLARTTEATATILLQGKEAELEMLQERLLWLEQAFERREAQHREELLRLKRQQLEWSQKLEVQLRTHQTEWKDRLHRVQEVSQAEEQRQTAAWRRLQTDWVEREQALRQQLTETQTQLASLAEESHLQLEQSLAQVELQDVWSRRQEEQMEEKKEDLRALEEEVRAGEVIRAQLQREFEERQVQWQQDMKTTLAEKERLWRALGAEREEKKAAEGREQVREAEIRELRVRVGELEALGQERALELDVLQQSLQEARDDRQERDQAGLEVEAVKMQLRRAQEQLRVTREEWEAERRAGADTTRKLREEVEELRRWQGAKQAEEEGRREEEAGVVEELREEVKGLKLRNSELVRSLVAVEGSRFDEGEQGFEVGADALEQALAAVAALKGD